MDNLLIFTTASELIQIRAKTLVYVAAGGNYSTFKLVDGTEYIQTLQLGRAEDLIAETSGLEANSFIRIGKSLIVNNDFISYINPAKQKIILSDGSTFRYELSASKEALKALKEYIEKRRFTNE